MPSGWAQLGAALGGDSQDAYEQARFRSAQTESALGMARQRQLENVALETKARERDNMDATLAESGVENPTLYGSLIRGEVDPRQLMGARLQDQERGFRATAADPATGALERTRALGAVAGRPYSDLDAIGPGGVTNITADVPTVESTPLGESMIDENVAAASAANALASLRGEQETNPAAFRSGGTPGGAPKPPANHRWVDDTYTRAEPIPGGPADPNRETAMGAREASFFNRIVGSANAMRYDLKNVMELPSGVSVGFLGTGVGATPGTTILQAVGGNLRNAISPTEVRSYNAMLSGMNRAMSFIEGQGLAGSNTLAASYDNLLLRPQDTVLDKMMKLAQMKQTVTAGIEPQLVSPRVPKAQKDYIQGLINDLNQTVPFDPSDVLRFQREAAGNPGLTLGAAIQQAGGDTTLPEQTPPAVAPEGSMPSPQSQEDYLALPPGTRFLAPDGSERIKP